MLIRVNQLSNLTLRTCSSFYSDTKNNVTEYAWNNAQGKNDKSMVSTITKIIDVVVRITSLEWSWVGHIERQMNVGPKKPWTEDHLKHDLDGDRNRGGQTELRKLQAKIGNGKKLGGPTSRSGYKPAKREVEEDHSKEATALHTKVSMNRHLIRERTMSEIKINAWNVLVIYLIPVRSINDRLSHIA